ncbi:Retrovirus-related Pol polyprotein from transposon TNT 1-94, partial [Linum perenne]
ETEIEGALAATHIQAEKGNLPPQTVQRESQTSSSAKPIYNTYSTGRGRGFYHQGRGGGYYTQGRGNSFLPGRGGGEYQKRFFSFPPCKYCGKQHSSTRCWRRPDAKCTKCNQLGHETWLCRNDYENSAEEAKVADQEEEEEDHLLVASCYASQMSSKAWLIDSGCTNHMTFNKDLFKDLIPTTQLRVKIGDGTYLPVKGKGAIELVTTRGSKQITDVLYVPDLDQNLLSVTQLLAKGYRVFFEEKLCHVYDGTGKEVLCVEMRGKSFSFNPMEEEHSAYPSQNEVTNLWHKRLGHCNLKMMLKMQKEDVIS